MIWLWAAPAIVLLYSLTTVSKDTTWSILIGAIICSLVPILNIIALMRGLYNTGE